MSSIDKKIERSPYVRNSLNALRSFLPEETIIEHSSSFNARAALAYKYEAQSSRNNRAVRMIGSALVAKLTERHSPNPGTWLGYAAAETDNIERPKPEGSLNLRMRMLAGPALTRLVGQPAEASKWEWLDTNVTAVESNKPSPVTAYDAKNDVILQRGSMDATFIHTDDVMGVEDAYEQLGAIAKYIADDSELVNKPLVAGVTYEGMARLGTRLGLKQMQVTDIDHEYAAHLRAAHTWTYFYNQKPKAFKPAAVYLPTEEFIQRFGQNSSTT